jgi:hypothetical protein
MLMRQQTPRVLVPGCCSRTKQWKAEGPMMERLNRQRWLVVRQIARGWAFAEWRWRTQCSGRLMAAQELARRPEPVRVFVPALPLIHSRARTVAWTEPPAMAR